MTTEGTISDDGIGNPDMVRSFVIILIILVVLETLLYMEGNSLLMETLILYG